MLLKLAGDADASVQIAVADSLVGMAHVPEQRHLAFSRACAAVQQGLPEGLTIPWQAGLAQQHSASSTSSISKPLALPAQDLVSFCKLLLLDEHATPEMQVLIYPQACAQMFEVQHAAPESIQQEPVCICICFDIASALYVLHTNERCGLIFRT